MSGRHFFRHRTVPYAVTTMLPALFAVAGVWAGCSASTDDDGDGVFANGGSGQGADGVGADTSSGGGGASNGGNGVGAGINIGGSGTGGLGDSACVGSSALAEPIPLDMIVLLDKSGSMSGQNWNDATAAISSFVQSPEADGVSAGIHYFPTDDAQGNDCNPDVYKNLAVDIGPVGPMGANTQLIINSLNTNSPTGLTPMYGGLQGVLQRATAQQDAQPDHKVVVILASDGSPNNCSDNTAAGIGALAAAAYNYNGVRTYTIGITGANLTLMTQVAADGGGEFFDITGGNATQFAQKMEEIRLDALGCEFIIPDPPMGEILDPDLVNVEYTPSNGGQTQSFPKAASAADCGGSAAWYYDNPQNPTKILLCPGACSLVGSDPNADINIEFGCESIAM